MKKGNIFLCDHKNLHGVKPNTINGKQQYLTAPLVLLHKTPDDKLMPIAIQVRRLRPEVRSDANAADRGIGSFEFLRLFTADAVDLSLVVVLVAQLKQTPAGDNPIFVPADSEYDWLMAKIFVRSADFSEHQLNAHLLRTHLLAEVFALSLLRNVPMVHPLYKVTGWRVCKAACHLQVFVVDCFVANCSLKLLIPHTRYTLQINYFARLLLIADEGVFTEVGVTQALSLVSR